ncbi:MAG TPA: elongation factor G [bacterium]|nr:elongation factor G [bacterium]
MKDFMVDKIRNMVLIGHGGCGKTTLAEALVFNMGEINRMGTIDDGTTQSDYHPDEIERKISISTSLLQGEWKEWKMNILDTPGYSDFIGDTKASLRVADLAVVVLNSIEGIEVGTEMAIEFADEYKIPLLFFANRLDNEHADFEKTLNSARDRYGNGVVAVQFPVNSGEGFNKIVDCLSMKLLTLESDGKVTSVEIPEEFKARAVETRDKLIEAAAESDDTLLESYFEAGTLTDEQLVQGLHKGIASGVIKPLLGGAAFRNLGIKTLLDFIGKYGPGPSDRPVPKGNKLKSQEELERTASTDQPMSGLVFKTISEAHVGELSLIRMYSGTIQSGNEVLNSTQQETEKIGQIYFLNGRNRKEIGQLKAGDIGALVKLKHTSTGDTLCDKRDPIVWKPIQFPDPVISVAISPKSRGDEEKISNGLHVLHDEDPSFTIVNDAELRQTIISGQGELHLKVIIKKLKERFGVEVDERRPKVPYRETITAKSDDKYRHKKQTGGAGQFAEVWMRIEPMDRGEGFAFENEVKGGSISGVFIPAIEKGIKHVLVEGPLAGYKVVDVKAIVYDGKEHPVDSKEIAFQTAGREVFKSCFLKARPILLEPIYNVEVKVPETCMGDVMGDLSSRRGKIMGMDTQGRFQIIKAQVPLADLDRYATTLRSITSGRGIYSRSFSHYEPVPRELEARIIEEAKAEKEREAEK